MKEWFKKERFTYKDIEFTPMDAFKSFDIDFDGKVSKSDLTKALNSFLKIPVDQITECRLDRLVSVLSFYNKDTL